MPKISNTGTRLEQLQRFRNLSTSVFGLQDPFQDNSRTRLEQPMQLPVCSIGLDIFTQLSPSAEPAWNNGGKTDGMIDYQGITIFLLLTFGVTYGIEILLILAGLRFRSGLRPDGVGASYMRYVPLLIGILMWVPGLAALFTTKFVTHEGLGVLNLRFGPWKPYLTTALIIPAVFLVIYGLTWLLGLAKPDWQMKTLAPSSKIPPPLLLLGIFFASTVLGPTINGLFGLGEEIGWRGYLLPHLMPLGKFWAFLILGIIWGLWHAPLIAVGFNYPGYPILGMVGMAAMTTTFGIFINDFTLRYQSVILAGWIHGACNGQIYGVWRVLFPNVNPMLGGFTGAVGIAVWLLVGLLL